MKKKEKQNPQKDGHKDLEYLQKKLGEEKQNLIRENKKLQKQIYEEIQQNRLMKIEYEKRQKQYQTKIIQLKRQIQNLKTEMLLEKDNSHDDQLQGTLKSTKDACRALMDQNQFLKNNIEQFEQTMAKMQQDINNIKSQNNKYKRKIKDEQAQIKVLRKQSESIKQHYRQLQQQSQKTIRQLERQIQENRKLQSSLTNQKKKNKQINQILKMLEEKMQELKQSQYRKYDKQINQIKRQKEQLEHQIMQQTTQIQFMRISQTKKQTYLQAITKQLNQFKGVYQNNNKQLSDKVLNLQKVQNQNRRLTIEYQNYKSKTAKQIEQLQKMQQQQITKIKRKTADQIGLLIRPGMDNKMIENYVDGLRSHKSHMNLRGSSTNPNYNNHNRHQEQKVNMPFQKFKYQNQIIGLNSQIQSLKRKIQDSMQQLQRTKRHLQEQKQHNRQKSQKIREQKLQLQRAEVDKKTQVQKVYRQLTKLKNIQTQLLQTKHEYIDLQQATNLKIAYYDKKIKQYLDLIQRKQNMIEAVKNQRYDSQTKLKILEDKHNMVCDQLEILKRFKNDVIRKDELVKDYKQKIEKFKQQIQANKNQIQKLKKQKTRLQRNLQSKQQYINTLKSKSAKEQHQKQQNLHAKQQKVVKQLKQKYENKLKKLKKQLQEFQYKIESIKNVVAQKIIQAVQKPILQQNAKNSTNMGMLGQSRNGWQAAQLLGLKSNQIQQFINPTINMDRDICQNLEELWDKREYEEFIRNSIQYLLLKNRTEAL